MEQRCCAGQVGRRRALAASARVGGWPGDAARQERAVGWLTRSGSWRASARAGACCGSVGSGREPGAGREAAASARAAGLRRREAATRRVRRASARAGKRGRRREKDARRCVCLLTSERARWKKKWGGRPATGKATDNENWTRFGQKKGKILWGRRWGFWI